MQPEALETVLTPEVVEAAAAGGDALARRMLYLVAAILFVRGLKGLTHPRTAVRGNLMSAVGMLLAVVATLFFGNVLSLPMLIVALAIGSAIGAFLAIKVQMTQMPQLVGLFNGFGGAASMLVAGMALFADDPELATVRAGVATAATGLIGSVTFFGSLIAAAKLQELKSIEKIKIPLLGNTFATGTLLVVCLVVGAHIATTPGAWFAYLILCILAAVLGVVLVLPIGGADMPVVISLLNSYSGLAACAAGFVISNSMLIIAGALVGAAGLILTQIMCKAMNRSLANVIFGTLGPTGETATEDEVYAGKIKATSADEVAMLLEDVRRVVIVPGYGMAVAQAQHAVRQLELALEERGVQVEYAIHPVAGRMPGHMNVLLAESDVPYEKLREMDDINPTMPEVDVAIVLGANDVVNPVARDDPKSPIAGMPIIEADKANTVIVVKRSLSPGFAGIPNPLFAMDNALMLFGDGKQMMIEVVESLKDA